MNRRKFLESLALIGAVTVISPSSLYGFLPKPSKNTSSVSSEGISGTIEDLLGPDFEWFDSSQGIVPDGIFSPEITTVILPPMGLRINDADFGWMHRYISQTQEGYKPQVSVSGNENLDVYSSIRPVPGMNDVYFVDLLFRPTLKSSFTDNVVINFDQINGIDGKKIYQADGIFKDINIFPNPTNGTINMTYSLYKPSPVSVEIYNTRGQRLFSENLPSNSLSGSFRFQADLASGIYFIRLSSNKKHYDFKISVVK